MTDLDLAAIASERDRIRDTYLQEGDARAVSSARVDLESFSAAKRSDRIILRLSSQPQLMQQEDGLRLREAVVGSVHIGVLCIRWRCSLHTGLEGLEPRRSRRNTVSR